MRELKIGKETSNYIDGRTNKKYCCKNCGKRISVWSGVYGQGRCSSCSALARPKRKIRQYLCLECGVKISKRTVYCGTKLCRSCAHKGRRNNCFGKKYIKGLGKRYKKIFMRSSYEIAYAKYLDKMNIEWLYEPKTFKLEKTTYTPDFYLPIKDRYVEIKGYCYEDAKEKMKEFVNIYKKNFIILDEKKLKQIGVL